MQLGVQCRWPRRRGCTSGKEGGAEKWEGRGYTSEEEGEGCLQMTERDERDCAD